MPSSEEGVAPEAADDGGRDGAVGRTRSTTYARLEGVDGMAGTVRRLVRDTGRDEQLILVFDFDRTLTAGGGTRGNNRLDAPIGSRVRGGRATLDALAHAKGEGRAAMYVVTARAARPMMVETIRAALEGPQRELKEFFALEGEARVVVFRGATLAHSGSVYASDYEKAQAVAHILERQERGRRLRVAFFDDNARNAHAVGIGTSPAVDAGFSLHVFWWDPFNEEFGDDAIGAGRAQHRRNATLGIPSLGPDFSYADENHRMLCDFFGVAKEESARRLGLYRRWKEDCSEAEAVSQSRRLGEGDVRSVANPFAGKAFPPPRPAPRR